MGEHRAPDESRVRGARPLTAGTLRRGYLPTLDGWRAIAILGVMLAHGSKVAFGPAIADTLGYGVKGVDLFFGISGFLICSRLLEEIDQRGNISLGGFYIRRFARILPPYAALLIALTVMALLGAAISARELLASVFFVRNYLPHASFDVWRTGHLWSLAVEEHFYLIWPTLLFFWKPNRAVWRVVVFAVGIAAWRVVEFRLKALDHVLPGVSFFMRTDIRFDALLWGCWVALALHEPHWREKLAVAFTMPARIAIRILVIVVIVVPIPLGLMWQSILIPLMLAGTVLNPKTILGNILEWRPVAWIGRISYSLYLWQQIFLLPERGAQYLDTIPKTALAFAMVFACAIASYHLIERPMIRVGHRLAPPTTEGRK